MKIAAIIPYNIYPPTNGGQYSLVNFYTALSNILPVTMFTTSNSGDADNTNIKQLKILGSGKKRYVSPTIIKNITRTLKTEQITHLIIEHPYHAAQLFWLRKLLDLPIIIRSHNLEYLRFKQLGKPWWFLLKQYEGYAYSHANLTTFITEEDLNVATNTWHLKNKTTVCTYGTFQEKIPAYSEKIAAQEALRNKYGVDTDTRILFFNGDFSYQPNASGVQILLEKILPELDRQHFRYHLIIAGKKMPDGLQQRISKNPNINYQGFVPDIRQYYLGSDVFVNPIIEGGGIKTKLVDALAYNVSSVSTNFGSMGVSPTIAGTEKLIIEDDWESFAKAIIKIEPTRNTQPTLYQFFNWNNIAQKLVGEIKAL